MDDLFLFYAAILAALLIFCYMAAEWNARRNFKDAILFQADLRRDRDQLRHENENLRTELYGLRQEVLELRLKLNVALDQIAVLSSTLHAAPG